ncbi:NAD(P)H-hydrate dehydratase [Paenibacillus sp. JX-17]|uniref:Bifunctional NAD(P)H-hydrate repair enzyme n=1 Tax=Paenibacillus lacisoli TaxID=3064525 RepID=A0ABT9CGB0_9BACL|nr:NAD(P)H-hydrate dehydratase [Paenibacillus sp. JX-17]MDO7906716.1 NAD(P)H-hydrate dehydratase [Paenibacillus sp. JX-17]
MYIVTSEEMRRLDQHMIEKMGIPAASLMENAGKAIAEEVLAYCRRQHDRGGANHAASQTGPGDKPNRGGIIRGDAVLRRDEAAREHWLILAGKGNNGGDGLVAARHLRDAGVRVTIIYAEPPEALRGEAALQRDAAAALGIPARVYGRDEVSFDRCTGAVDALLGTGSRGAPRGPYAELIGAAVESGVPVVAADIPSGLDADTGEVQEPHIRAQVTVCLACLKRGLVQYPGAVAAGEVVVRAIGIPALQPGLPEPPVQLLTEETLADALGVDIRRQRDPDGHKGTYGHVLLAAGSLRMSGAGLLASRSALRIGSGLVTWALPSALLPRVIGAVPELMLAAAADTDDGEWNAASAEEVLRLAASRDVLAAGPGLGRFEGDTGWLRRLWEESDRPLVIDADGLNMLADAGDGVSAWGRRQAPVVLTPHPGEMGRLLGVPTAEVQRDRIGCALDYAHRRGVTLVLKGARTVIASPDGTAYVNTTGHAGMATGGAGDVLTGIIAGLLAQGLSAPQAAAFGVYLHGLAGEKAARLREDPASILAGDLVEAL